MTRLERCLPHFHSGKTRDTFRLPEHPELLFMNASQRASSHNVKHKTLFPEKDELLNAQMMFWVGRCNIFPEIPTHVVAAGEAIWEFLPKSVRDNFPHLERTGLVVKKRKPHMREFVWRLYLAGSLYRTLQAGEDPYGFQSYGYKKNAVLMHRFLEPIFTPTMKSEHDEPMSAAVVAAEFPRATSLTRHFVLRAAVYLNERGVALIDTKLEADEEMLLDEFGTGDSSRFARTDSIREGENPPFLDKEILRQIAEKKWGDRPKTPLTFSTEEVADVMRGYHEAFELITGTSLAEFQQTSLDYRAPI